MSCQLIIVSYLSPPKGRTVHTAPCSAFPAGSLSYCVLALPPPAMGHAHTHLHAPSLCWIISKNRSTQLHALALLGLAIPLSASPTTSQVCPHLAVLLVSVFTSLACHFPWGTEVQCFLCPDTNDSHLVWFPFRLASQRCVWPSSPQLHV